MAASLARGDACAAAGQATGLRAATVDAINEGRVPPPLQEELLSAVNELESSIECAPAPAPPTVEDEDDDDEDDDDDEEGDD